MMMSIPRSAQLDQPPGPRGGREPGFPASGVAPSVGDDGNLPLAGHLGDRARLRFSAPRSPRPARPLSLLLSRRVGLRRDHLPARSCKSRPVSARAQPMHGRRRLSASWAMRAIRRVGRRLHLRHPAV